MWNWLRMEPSIAFMIIFFQNREAGAGRVC